MTERSIIHASFVIERTYEASPARVFGAWADPAIKARWFGEPEEFTPIGHTMDFRVGGRESTGGKVPDGPTYTYEAVYQDIIPNERIVSTYEMEMDGVRISVSLATVQFSPAGAGTKLLYTEYGAYLDGLDAPADREQGTIELLDSLGKVLQSETATA